MEIQDFKPKEPVDSPASVVEPEVKPKKATPKKKAVVKRKKAAARSKRPRQEDSPTHEAMRQASSGKFNASTEDGSIFEEPLLSIESEDGEALSPTELVDTLKEAGVELKDRAKAAGMQPIQEMVASFVSKGLSIVDGLLEALEGKKKKGS